MAKLTIDQIKRNGCLKVSDEIISASRSQLADLFNADKNDKKYKDFYFSIKKKIGEKEVDNRVWSVKFGSKEIQRFNHLSEDGMEIRETLENSNTFDMEKGERAVFRLEDNYNSWKFLGVFKFAGKVATTDSEKLNTPCYTNRYERVSDGLILEDWQNEKHTNSAILKIL